MKKIFHILLLAVFLLGTTGVTISEHYCSGHLISFSFFGKANDCCGHGCKSCHNSIFVQKVKNNFDSSSFKIDAVKIESSPITLFFSTYGESDIFGT